MECIYSCEKYNPHNINQIDSIIVDETEIITSPAYLHTFRDEISDEKYCVVSDSIGVSMPYLKMDNEFCVGTSRYIYFFDGISRKTERIVLNSPCTKLLIYHNKIIVICECDVAIISLVDKRVVAEFEFSDVISDYMMQQDFMIICLMEGTEQKIDLSGM